MRDSRGKFLRRRRRRSRKKSRDRMNVVGLENERSPVGLPVGNNHSTYNPSRTGSHKGPVNGPIIPSRAKQILLTCHALNVISSPYVEVHSLSWSLPEEVNMSIPHHRQNDDIILVDQSLAEHTERGRGHVQFYPLLLSDPPLQREIWTAAAVARVKRRQPEEW